MEHYQILKAISHENRLKMFSLLLFGEICICDFEEHLQLKQANVSKHMMVFKEYNMVVSRREGKSIHYRLDDTFVTKHHKLIDYLKEQTLNNQEIMDIVEVLQRKDVCSVC